MDNAWGQAVGSGVSAPRMAGGRVSPVAAPAGTRAAAAGASAARLSPIQELHRQSYYQAIEAGYSPAQARAHADAVVARQQPHITDQQAQVWERNRIAQQQQAAAAQQNARLWQSLQQQRGQMQAQGARMPQVAPTQAAPAQPPMLAGRSRQPMGNTSGPSANSRPTDASIARRLDDSEARGVKTASAQLARVQARGQRIEPTAEIAPGDESTLTLTPPRPTTIAQVPARLAGDAAPPQPMMPPRSVLDSGLELELSGPVGATNEPALLPGPAPNAIAQPAVGGNPANGPALLPTRGNPSTPSAAAAAPAAESPGTRVPRKLPQVDPQPLPTPRRDLEIELEGFTDELLNVPPAQPAQSQPNRPVAYQQPLETPSYANQAYTPRLGQGSATLPVSPPMQLVEFPNSPAQQPSVGGLAIEPIPSDSGHSDSSFGNARSAGRPNGQWQEDMGVSPQVPPPAGIRVTPVSSGGRRAMGSYSPRAYQDAVLDPQSPGAAEPMPAPRQDLDFDRDDAPGLLKSCAELKQDLLGISLRDISLDLSTPVSTLTNTEATLVVRDWRDSRNAVITRGRALSASTTEVQIEEESGLTRSLSLAELSARDQKYAWDMMNLPFECGFGSTALHCRSFAPSHVSWHASNLCHKPLYFEDIQLERYGHTVGPIRQPVKSAVRFLAQAALLPYQMALHPPNECQYPLGLFRPGNCAPYLRTPFPWERRAIGYQAGVATGLFLLVP